MSPSQGFELHPGAAADLTEIWEFIARDNLTAAGSSAKKFLRPYAVLRVFLIKATRGPTSLLARFDFRPFETI
jgi:plasmid stabilization system protein ParE